MRALAAWCVRHRRVVVAVWRVKANWWLPRGLDRVLPHLNVEGNVQQELIEVVETPTDRKEAA